MRSTKFTLIILTLVVLLAHGTSTGQSSGEMPLSQQLEGLGPQPRLAYLRHLMAQGRVDADVMFQTAVAYHELGRTDSARL